MITYKVLSLYFWDSDSLLNLSHCFNDLCRMVEEILDTRLMVKRCMSRYKSDKGLHKLLHARQLGLKLIANVTFGYAAANFSGRMPCVEVGVETKINVKLIQGVKQ